MAAEYAKREYVRSATYGSVAYDLRRVVPEIEAPAADSEKRERVREKAKPEVKTAANPKLGISPFSVVGFCLIAVLMVLVILANVKLTEISYTSSQTRNRIVELEKEREQLEVKYERAFNLNELRTYAINELGMTEATAAETVLIGSVKADKAVILDESVMGNENAVKDLSSFVHSLLEYFK